MNAIPPFLLFEIPLEKGFVQGYTRADGVAVKPHFTKRQPAKIKEKHTRERYYDHDSKTAKKAHAELEEKKRKHKDLLEAAKRHHKELSQKGASDKKEGGKVSHQEKLAHLEAEIKNQQQHIDNHSRKQQHIANRHKISEKQLARKRNKQTLEKILRGDYTDAQKKTIRKIFGTVDDHKLEPTRILHHGKDKNHIYLETQHKDTGKIHHIPINGDSGKVINPQVIHSGKFDQKHLKEPEQPKEPLKETSSDFDQTVKDYQNAKSKSAKEKAKKKARQIYWAEIGGTIKDFLTRLNEKPSEKPAKDESKLSGQELIDYYLKASKKRNEQINKFIDKNGETPFTYKTKGGLTVMLHKSTKANEIKQGYQWQLSILGADGKPNGDSRFKTYEAAVQDAARTWKVDLSKVTIKKLKSAKKPEKTEAEKHESRSQGMKGNKNAYKGGPKEEPKKNKPAAFIRKDPKPVVGKKTKVITARSKQKHDVQYRVMEANDKKLVASNHADGKINKDYPQLSVKGALQMRDRSNIQSKAQITQMANDLEPMFLTDSKIASDGAPIVGADYDGKKGHAVVESGNGRIMAIRTAYENGKADHYKQHLIDEAESFGLDPKAIKAMENPILVRQRVDELSDEEKALFAKEANKATVSQMTATEQAIEDSNFLGDLSNLNPTEDGRITYKNNSAFIKDFFSLVMGNDSREVGKLLNKDGHLNDEGERRITNAVFVRVYGAHSDIMNKLIMKDSDQTKKITAGMLAAAPRMAKFKAVMEKHDRRDLDISANFIDALTAMEDLKRSGISLEEKLATVDWSEHGVEDGHDDPLKNPDVVEVLELIKENGAGIHGSANKISTLLINYADEAEKAIYADDPNRLTIEDAMGEDRAKSATKTEILKQAKDEVAFIKADRGGEKKHYEAYLEEYPEGRFATQAKEKLAKLERETTAKGQIGF